MKKSLLPAGAGTFLKGFIRSPREVGSVIPSSHWLVEALLDETPIEKAQVIAEFGPGTGVFTDEIIRRLRPDAKLLVFEVDQDFANKLRERISDKRVEIINDS